MAANKKASATKVKGTRTPKNAAASGKVHTGRFINDEAYDEDTHDFGPWIMTPKSTRVGGFRYDFANRAVHVQWHGKGLTRSYMYTEVPYEIYRAMVRIASKGQFINSTMNSFDYREATPDEVDAPSNDERTAPQSRANA
jgi:hypothetical protein